MLALRWLCSAGGACFESLVESWFLAVGQSLQCVDEHLAAIIRKSRGYRSGTTMVQPKAKMIVGAVI